jgi:hypothetical protein
MKSLSELFKETGDFESFKNAVIKLAGDFDFNQECMIDLGSAYLEKYPDRFSKRNIDEVHLGYNLVRVCVIEKIIKNIRGDKRDAFRNILNNFSGSQKVLDNLIRAEGKDDIAEDYDGMNSELQKISGIIDEIPKGMIKERFIGGVTNIINIIYLLKMKLKT